MFVLSNLLLITSILLSSNSIITCETVNSTIDYATMLPTFLTNPAFPLKNDHLFPRYGSHYRRHRYDYDYHDMSYRSDYYWLIPAAFIIGTGALLLPVFSVLLTIMATSGTINLTAGRKRRSLNNDYNNKNKTNYLEKLMSSIDKELAKFKQSLVF